MCRMNFDYFFNLFIFWSFILVWTHAYLFCNFVYNPLYYSLVAQMISFWLLKALSVDTLFLWHAFTDLFSFYFVLLLSTSLLSNNYKILQTHLFFFPAPALESVISIFSKDTWFFLLENSVRNQDQDDGCAHCFLLESLNW